MKYEQWLGESRSDPNLVLIVARSGLDKSRLGLGEFLVGSWLVLTMAQPGANGCPIKSRRGVGRVLAVAGISFDLDLAES